MTTTASRVIPALTLVSILLASCGYTPTPTTPTPTTGDVTVSISGLPSGEAADVTLRRPDQSALDLTGSQTLKNQVFGQYTVSAHSVAPGGVPYTASVTPAQVVLDATHLQATVKVQYAPPLTGSLKLNVAGVPTGQHPLLHLSGPNGYTADLSSLVAQTLSDLAPGDYTLSADTLRDSNFNYPASVQPATVTVQRGRTAVVNTSYARDPNLGNLSVRLLGLPEGAVGRLTATGADSVAHTLSGSGILTDLPRGRYTLSVPDVTFGGMTYHASVTGVNVPGADTALLDVTYTASTGRLLVVVNSPVTVPTGSISVGLAGQAPVRLNQTQTLDDLTPGAYSLTASVFSAAGWTYVPTVDASAALQAGVTVGASVTYVRQEATGGVARDLQAPSVSLDPDPSGAYTTLSGTASDNVGVTGVQVFDGSESLGAATLTADGTWSLHWTPAPGPHDLTVIASDAAGNEGRLTQTVALGRN